MNERDYVIAIIKKAFESQGWNYEADFGEDNNVSFSLNFQLNDEWILETSVHYNIEQKMCSMDIYYPYSVPVKYRPVIWKLIGDVNLIEDCVKFVLLESDDEDEDSSDDVNCTYTICVNSRTTSEDFLWYYTKLKDIALKYIMFFYKVSLGDTSDVEMEPIRKSMEFTLPYITPISSDYVFEIPIEKAPDSDNKHRLKLD